MERYSRAIDSFGPSANQSILVSCPYGQSWVTLTPLLSSSGMWMEQEAVPKELPSRCTESRIGSSCLLPPLSGLIRPYQDSFSIQAILRSSPSHVKKPDYVFYPLLSALQCIASGCFVSGHTVSSWVFYLRCVGYTRIQIVTEYKLNRYSCLGVDL